MRPLAPMLGLLVAFGCTRAQPRASAKPWPGRCELPQQRAPAHVTHDDYRRLLPFRPYVRVAQVGPWADHVTVWFGCIEANVARFEVSPRGDLKLLGSAWGGVAVEPKDVPAVPAEGRAAVDRVRAWFAEVAPDASISRARYDGRYRRVTLVGLVPFDPAGPQRRMGAAATLTFGASEDLTRVVGPAASGISSDEGFLCSAGECGEPPKWLSLESPAGTLAAMRAARRDPGASPFVRDALEQIRLGRSPSLDAILSNQDASDAIPREGLPRVEVSLRLFGKDRTPPCRPTRASRSTCAARPAAWPRAKRRSRGMASAFACGRGSRSTRRTSKARFAGR